MEEDRIYKLQDGTEKILISHTMIKDKRYLLLYDEQKDEHYIAYEENKNLVFIDENNENYKYLLEKLYQEIN